QRFPGRTAVDLGRFVLSTPVEAAVFPLVSVCGGHFVEGLEAGGWLLLTFAFCLGGKWLLLARPFALGSLDVPDCAVAGFLFLRGELVTSFGLLVEFLDSIAVDGILACRDAQGNTQDEQSAEESDDTPGTTFPSSRHRWTSLSKLSPSSPSSVPVRQILACSS